MGSISADKQKAIQLAMDQIECRFGKSYIMKLGGRMLTDVSVISSSYLMWCTLNLNSPLIKASPSERLMGGTCQKAA